MSIERINYIETTKNKKGRTSVFVSPESYPEKVPLIIDRKVVENYFITKAGVVLKLKHNKKKTEMKVLILSTRKDNNVVVGINGRVCLLHCLLVESFIPDLKPKYYVKHKDGNRSNIDFSNLICYETAPMVAGYTKACNSRLEVICDTLPLGVEAP